jgi:hypothetical protein
MENGVDMPRYALRWLVFPLLAALAACGANGVDTTPLAPMGPAVSPASLTFTAAGQTQAISVSDPGLLRVLYTVSGCDGVVTAGAVSNGSLTVTSVAAGSCTLTVSDTLSRTTTVSVGVMPPVHSPAI